MDGDARGGAALSVVAVVGVPIVFSGSGERLDDLEPFRPDRMVSRMLGMGDILTLVDRAEEVAAEQQAQRVERRAPRDQFTLEDMRQQMNVISRMGPLDQLLGLIPGLGAPAGGVQVDPGRLTRVAAIIDSMTREERRKPGIINGSRRKRVARGSGTTVEEVNRLLKQFAQMRRVLKNVQSGAGARGSQARRLRKRLRIPGALAARR